MRIFKQIVKIALFFIPSLILFFYYIKKNLTKLFESDIFDIDLSEDEEEL